MSDLDQYAYCRLRVRTIITTVGQSTAMEISFIIVPILAPVAEAMGINMLWFAILIAMNLQTSFLTPPFGFSLFYLKGVAPPEVRTTDIYKGIIPFILIQILVLALIVIFPEWFGMSATY